VLVVFGEKESWLLPGPVGKSGARVWRAEGTTV